MARSGLEAIFFGLESAARRCWTRRCARGWTSARGNRQCRRATGRAVRGDEYDRPLPFDTPETIQRSLDFLLEVRPDSIPVQVPGLLPGTPWMENPERYNFGVDRERALLMGLDYRIKLLFPPQFWDPLPYTVNGLDFREFSTLTLRFTAQLEAAGLLTGVPTTWR